jgi:hypothetical protein
VNPQVIGLATEFLSGLLAPRRRPPVRWPLLILGGVVGLIGTVFLAIAADLTLAQWLSPPAAAAITGGGLVAIALILAWIALHQSRALPRAEAESLPIAALIEFATNLVGEFEGAVQSSPKSAAAAAFAAGCVVGCNTGLHRGLSDLIR